MTTFAEHNHPPMQTCPEGCPVTGSGADLDVYPDAPFSVTATDTGADITVDSDVDNPAPDSESAQVSDPAPVDTPVDNKVDNAPDGETAKERKNRLAREARARKKAESEPPPEDPPADETEPTDETAAKVRDIVQQVKDKPARGKKRMSGDSAGQEEAEKAGEAVDDEAAADPKVDVEAEADWFRAPGFQRMKTAWEGDDKRQMDRIQVTIDRVVFETFTDAYAVMSDIYDLVREPMIQEGGEIQTDPAGFTLWARNPLTGAYIEDWSNLTIRQREDFLFRITTSLFEWEQRAADLHTRAMFSKGMFVEKFAIEYDAPISGTIDDRNARGNKEAAEDRYFALMNSAVSRKAEALVRAMTNLMLRLKDTLGQ
jgi:hypothetical protein